MKNIPSVIVASFLSLGLVLTAVSHGAEIPTTHRVDRVLNGLRPKVEAEGVPVRWSLAERMAAYKVPGVSIAIIDGGRVVWAGGFGVTAVGGHDPVTATTLFQVASCSKPIAASAMLRLVDKGTLQLDTNVNRYLTSWKLPENEFTKMEPVTLRRLANHTGGDDCWRFPGIQGRRGASDGSRTARRESAGQQRPGARRQAPGSKLPLLGRRLHDHAATPRRRNRHAFPDAHGATGVRSAGHAAQHLRAAAFGCARLGRRAR